ncbi:hypothetical protein, partial [Aestuariivirga sp.]|uniref:hypothetical protein n=1 Tax=Aestuariivirga sp. TaxID=2650926 RepID=UPI0037840A22
HFKAIVPLRPPPRRLTASLMPHNVQTATPASAFSTEFGTSPSDQVEPLSRKELAQDQWLDHDLITKVVSTFADHALTAAQQNIAMAGRQKILM